MRGLLWIVCGGVLAVNMGCGSGAREDVIDTTLSTLNNVATKVGSINDEITKAVKEADKKKTTPDFKTALEMVAELKESSKKLLESKNRAESIKGTLSEEERKELSSRFKSRLNQALEDMANKQVELNKTLKSVEAQHKDAVKELRAKLREAEGEFEVLSRQR